MKKTLIFFSVLLITFIAFWDLKDRFEELDEISANTPSQVEMKQMMQRIEPQMKKDNIQTQDNTQTFEDKMKEDTKNNLQNQFDSVNKRRDTINNKIP